MNSADQEKDPNELSEKDIKFEITPSISDYYDDDTAVDTNNQLDMDDSNDTASQLNILKYEQINDTLINYEQYNIPDKLNSREKRTFLRMRGLAYIGGSKKCPKLMEARKLGATCKSTQCARIQTRHCNEFTEEQRQEIFSKFWYEMNWPEKRLYVREHVIVVEPSRRRSGSINSRRQNTMKFYLSKNKIKLQVCKTMFASTLALGETFVREWVQKPPSYNNKSNKNVSENTNTKDNHEDNENSFEFGEDETESSFQDLTEEIHEKQISIIIPKIPEKNTKNSKESKTELSNSSLTKNLNKNYSCLSMNQRKEIGKLCNSKYCHNNKCLQINNDQRNLIYKQFWFEMNYSEKLNYIQKNIEVIRTGPIKQNIMDSYYYCLKISKRRYPVCKKMFLSTLGLVEKHIEIICDDYKKYLLGNSDEPVEEEEEDGSDSSESNNDNYNLSPKNDDPLDVNIEYVDVNINDIMEVENTNINLESIQNLMEINESNGNVKLKNEQSTKPIFRSDDDDEDNMSARNSDQSSWKNDSDNDDNSFDEDEDDDLEDNCLTEKTLINNNKKKLNIKIKTEENVNTKNNYGTRSSNRILNKTENSKDSDEEFNSADYTEYSFRKRKTNKMDTSKQIQLSNGIIIPPEIGPPCLSTLCKKLSKRRCSDINEDQRKRCFNYFWHEMSLNDRKQYVKGNIEKFIELKIQKYKYNLIISNERFQVCKKMFINTLCLHEICIRNWLNNIDNYDYDLTNKPAEKQSIKGMKKLNNLMTNENTMEKIQILDEFLDSLPKIPPKTFYTQKSNKIYFNENITGSRNVFHMYLAQMKEDNCKCPLSKKILMKRLALKNLTFYKGKKLRLGKIDNDIKISDKEKQYLKRSQQEKYHDKALARKSSSTVLLNIDIFNVKMSPNIKCDAEQCDENSTTRLCCYNFTVCNILTLHGMCYWFCETDASNTNNSSFITCLIDYLNNSCKNSQQIIIYAKLNDSRLKNLDLANALLDYSIQMKKTIIQKFLPTNEKFETECDIIYKSIERKLRTFEIMLPSDYVTASIDARREPCEGKWMNFRVFKDYSAKSEKHRYYKLKSSNGKLIENFHGLLYKENGEILYKIEFDDEWSLVSDNFKCSITNEKLEWPQMYLERRKISAVKYQSLQSLKIQLPRDCHFFYDYLTIEI